MARWRAARRRLPRRDRVGRWPTCRRCLRFASPVIESFPRAAHWSEWTYEPGLNPTAGLVGLLYELGLYHPWREQAAEYCWQQLGSGTMPESVHSVLEALVFLDHVPERETGR